VRHCDEYIDDETAPRELRAFLARARQPAHGALDASPYPELYADYAGIVVRVTVASRFGDVGITTQLEQDHGYEVRVHVEELKNFRSRP